MENYFYLFFVTLFGAIFGSFLNVVIYRLPRKESLSFPPSHCPGCHSPIRWYDNIPLLSYIVLRGACRSCRNAISPVYPLVEAVTAVCALVLFMKSGFSVVFVREFILACILITATVIDLKYMIIPNTLNGFGALAGLGFAIIGGFGEIIRSVSGGMLGASCILAMLFLGRILYKRDGVGYGDVKLAGVMGLFLGPFWIVQSFVMSILIGGVWAISVLITGKRSVGQEVPFGPFLALGGYFTLFFTRQILYLVEMYLLRI